MSKLQIGDMYDGGFVYAIYLGKYLAHTFKDNYTSWDSLYPGWQDKVVYYLAFSKPIRSLTLEEYFERSPEGTLKDMIKEEYKQEYYEKFCPTHLGLSLPEQVINEEKIIKGDINV